MLYTEWICCAEAVTQVMEYMLKGRAFEACSLLSIDGDFYLQLILAA